MTRPSTKRKPQRPRLEVSNRSELSGAVDNDPRYPVVVSQDGCGDFYLNLKECTRLRKFLEKCEAYLAARKERK